ncbi:hypothetical protein N9C44_01250 [bacterium]|jgi:hypothetical protein|nr:hypothetical protein [bacterium]|tara:strand:+ start:1065 stop:1382 length:318 start_codon:yes stop_codon:yes gene_type:complete
MADNKKTEATEETVAPETTVDTNVNTDETQVPDSIGLADLQILAQIVDLSTQRGAFRGNELTQVGAVYDKLTTFLNYVAEANAEKEAEQGAEATAETPAEEPASA